MHLNAAHYNIVLLATNGQLGFELAQYLTAVGRVYCLNRADVDFVNVDVLLARIAEFKPDIIVNAAAWTAVDEAEAKPHAAYLMNAVLPSALATLAQQCRAWLVHYSTDYVYSGHGTAAWQETDLTSPLSVYGRTKLDGDNAVQQHCDKYLIFRTSWLYAARGNNFMRTMLKLGMQHESLSVVSDQIGAPTPAKLIAQTTISALQQVLQHGNKLSGIYHLVTKGETSWYGFAQAHGAKYKGRSVGTIGHIGAWSFCQDKIMITGGEGGMVTTNSKALWSTMWSYKDHGKSFEAVYEREHPPGFRWVHESFGTNWRMTEMQSVIGRIQLTRMQDWTAKRQHNAAMLDAVANKFSVVRVVQVAGYIEHAEYKHYFFVNPNKLSNGWSRDRIVNEIMARGVPCYQGSCSEVYLEKAFDNTPWRPTTRLPNAKLLGETSLMMLVHPTLTEQEMEKSCKVLVEVLTEATK